MMGFPGEGMPEEGLPASDQPLPVMLQASRGHSIAGCLNICKSLQLKSS